MLTTPPPGSSDPGVTIDVLIGLLQNLLTSTFLTGDFNLLHPRWDLYTKRSSPLVGAFTDWLDYNLFILTSENGASTHVKGNVLDLAFLMGPLTASTILASHLDVTLDYMLLLT